MEASAEVLRRVDSVHSVLGPKTAIAVAVLPTSSKVNVTVRILVEPSEALLNKPVAV